MALTRNRRAEVLKAKPLIDQYKSQTNNIVEACKRAGVTIQEYSEVFPNG